jgi:hypothetical protein
MTGTTLSDEAGQRGCYCSAWDIDPKLLADLGYPRGYCGFCQRCGQPGHTRCIQGPFSFTGSWCAFHYRLAAWLDPRAARGFVVWLLALVGVCAVVRTLL